MTTPTELLLKMMPTAVESLDKINRLGVAANRAQNPLTPTIIAAPIAKKGLEDAGEILNNKVISQQLDDPLIKAFAANNPFTGLLLGATGIARGFDSQSKIGKISENKDKPKFADLRGSKTPGSKEAAVDNSAADKAFAAAAKFQNEKNPPITPTPAEPGPKLDPNATESFKTAFNAGNNNMDQIQAMYADRPDLQKWAKANPALAQKEYLKKAFNTDGTPKILDKTAEGFDKPNAPGVVESVDGMQLPNSISINAANELLDNMSEADDSQAFLKNYIMAMQNN
jgi:hypothetical protein|tara:strand:- start:183 stop:1034 length:852 start_codon:yes stop_codon:yes gene_type:complete